MSLRPQEISSMPLNRRDWLRLNASVGLALMGTHSFAAEPPIRLGFSLYGMKAIKTADALKTCANIGYDCVELSLLPGYATEPKLLSVQDRRDLRKQLQDLNLTLPALMENLREPTDDAGAKMNEDRLKVASELAHELAPAAPPVIETILGGKPADWPMVKNRMVERMGAWADIAGKGKTVIAIKAHVANALHTPEDAIWLISQVKSPWLKLTYDHSHFALEGRKLADTAKAMLPESVFVHVKDEKGMPGKFEFLLPGTGTTDYREYARLLRAASYGGGVVVEVSGQIFNKPGYDPIAAAKLCYEKLKPALVQAA